MSQFYLSEEHYWSKYDCQDIPTEVLKINVISDGKFIFSSSNYEQICLLLCKRKNEFSHSKVWFLIQQPLRVINPCGFIWLRSHKDHHDKRN